MKVLYDGECPLCSREIKWLKKKDKHHRMEFIDLTQHKSIEGISQEELMKEIHVILPDGKVLKGVDAFYEMYQAIGWGWVWAPAKISFLRPIYKWAYGVFARNRLRWTGRG